VPALTNSLTLVAVKEDDAAPRLRTCVPPPQPRTIWQLIGGIVENPNRYRYKNPLPENPDRAVAVIHNGVIVMWLGHIGSDMEYLYECGGLDDELGQTQPDLGPTDSGVYVWEGVIRWEVYRDYWGEYDGEEHEWVGAWRPVTTEEAKATARGDSVWDPDLWHEPETVPESV